jgi:hypothetical protein
MGVSSAFGKVCSSLSGKLVAARQLRLSTVAVPRGVESWSAEMDKKRAVLVDKSNVEEFLSGFDAVLADCDGAFGIGGKFEADDLFSSEIVGDVSWPFVIIH